MVERNQHSPEQPQRKDTEFTVAHMWTSEEKYGIPLQSWGNVAQALYRFAGKDTSTYTLDRRGSTGVYGSKKTAYFTRY